MRRRRSQFHRSIYRSDTAGDPDINTTPLIDVMLVMLVMFIITIPPQTHMVDITLPSDKGIVDKIHDENFVTIDPAGVIRWNGEAVDLAQLGQRVKMGAEREKQPVLKFEPDARARYLRVDEAIGAIRRNGGTSIAFPNIHQYGGLI